MWLDEKLIRRHSLEHPELGVCSPLDDRFGAKSPRLYGVPSADLSEVRMAVDAGVAKGGVLISAEGQTPRIGQDRLERHRRRQRADRLRPGFTSIHG